MADEEQKARQAVCNDHLTKPFDEESLIQK